VSAVSRGLEDCLWQAIQTLATGRVEVLNGQSLEGTILLKDGRIAWATCKGQTETLGVFLWRLGRVSRRQLAEASIQYKENSGKKKLGTILQEMNLMDPPTLRRCLMLHTRSAVQLLLAQRDLEARFVELDSEVDEKILFGPEEVLPPDDVARIVSCWMETPEGEGWQSRDERNAILEVFMNLPGYLASAIVSADGSVVTAHAAQPNQNLAVLSVFVAGMIDASTRALHVTRLESIECLSVECRLGAITMRWIDPQQEYFVYLLCDERAKPSLLRYELKTAIPTLHEWLLRDEIPKTEECEAMNQATAAVIAHGAQAPPAQDTGDFIVNAFAKAASRTAASFSFRRSHERPASQSDVFATGPRRKP